MEKKKILLGFRFDPSGFKGLENEFELIYPAGESLTRVETLDMIGDVDVLVPNYLDTDREIIDAGKKLKLIANYRVGYNNIDCDYAAQKGIVVTNTPQSVLEPTADLAFSLLLATARRIGFFNSNLHQGVKLRWGIYDNLSLPVFGTTLGIYGMGRIGQAIARRAKGFGMKVIYHNRHRLDPAIEGLYDATYVDFDTLLRESDYLSLNAPATPETFHLMGDAQFAMMKPTSVVVNTARGSLIDEKALVKALLNKTIFAAGLDVYETEPVINPELLQFENVVLTPHVGTQTSAARLEMQYEVVKNILNFYHGGSLNKVN